MSLSAFFRVPARDPRFEGSRVPVLFILLLFLLLLLLPGFQALAKERTMRREIQHHCCWNKKQNPNAIPSVPVASPSVETRKTTKNIILTWKPERQKHMDVSPTATSHEKYLNQAIFGTKSNGLQPNIDGLQPRRTTILTIVVPRVGRMLTFFT